MVSYTMTGQLSGAFSEFVLPSLTRFISKEVVKVQEKRKKDKEKNGVDDDLPEEKEWLERVREESQLPAYDVSIDHLEMGLQFGYVVLWSSIWSLAPMMSWINNLVSRHIHFLVANILYSQLL
jgi:anoctamin-10